MGIAMIRVAAEAAKSNSSSTTRAKVIANKLRADILNGRLLPGAKLHLDDLKSALGVSLSPLREGLSRLAAEGLVTFEDQRGFSVAPVSKRNFQEIIDLRLILETKALRASIAQG